MVYRPSGDGFLLDTGEAEQKIVRPTPHFYVEVPCQMFDFMSAVSQSISGTETYKAHRLEAPLHVEGVYTSTAEGGHDSFAGAGIIHDSATTLPKGALLLQEFEEAALDHVPRWFALISAQQENYQNVLRVQCNFDEAGKIMKRDPSDSRSVSSTHFRNVQATVLGACFDDFQQREAHQNDVSFMDGLGMLPRPMGFG